MDIQVRHNGSPEGIAFVAAFNAAGRSMEVERQAWLAMLRGSGVKAATPDDGWVDRRENVFSFPSYADMPADCSPGDIVVLGRPTKWRPVRVTEVIEPCGIINWRRYRFRPIIHWWHDAASNALKFA